MVDGQRGNFKMKNNADKRAVVKFLRKKKVEKRIWGEEILLALIPKVLSLKILKMKKGSKGNLQYHHKKNECGYILSGKLKFTYQLKTGTLRSKILSKGDCFHIPPGAIHQEYAVTACQIIEASTPHFNDRVRVEKVFNLPELKGLKSTRKNEVILK